MSDIISNVNSVKAYTLPFTLEDVKLGPNTVLIAAVTYSEELTKTLRPGKTLTGVEPDHSYVKQVIAMGEITQAGLNIKVGDFIQLQAETPITHIPVSKSREDATRQHYYLLDTYFIKIAFDTTNLEFGKDYFLSIDKTLG